MSQVTDRFEAAVKTLIGDGPVKKRLITAYAAYLEDLQSVDLPVDDKSSFQSLHLALHGVMPAGRESPVQASVQKMSPTEAGEYAELILDLYRELVAEARKTEPLKIVERAEPASADGPESGPGAAADCEPPRYLVSRS
jgi:hypothetical protein